jgi:hypothetical protein
VPGGGFAEKGHRMMFDEMLDRLQSLPPEQVEQCAVENALLDEADEIRKVLQATDLVGSGRPN